MADPHGVATFVERTSAAQRVVWPAIVGAAAAVPTALLGPWQLSVLAGFDAAGAVYLALAWWGVRHLDETRTQHLARREDPAHRGTGTIALLVALAALGAVLSGLAKSSKSDGAIEAALVVGSVLAVAIGWLVVQTVFVFRYARRYFEDGIDKAIDFNDDGDPAFADFAYFAFTIGMTYQVSDTNIADRSIRRDVLRHALLSFVFGTAIIGTTINVMASLLGR